MYRSVKDPAQSGDDAAWRPLIAVGMVIGAATGAHESMKYGEAWYSPQHQQQIPVNPIQLTLGLMTHHLAWTGADTGGAITLVTGAAAIGAGAFFGGRWACDMCRELAGRRKQQRKQRRPRQRRMRREAVDTQAKYMARGNELADMSREAVADKARSLGVRLAVEDAPGVLIGRTVADGQDLYATYEDLHLDIWGPRQGKSSSRVIPAIMEAIGVVVATSNKRDVVDATRTARARRGRVHVFDPQQVAEEPCTWYWDPVAWVAGSDGGVGAQRRAAELAGHFAAGGEASSKDAFFDPEGEDLLAALLLACALAKKPVTQAYEWVTRPNDQEPVEILDAHGYGLLAAGCSDQYYSPDKQRSGVFATAKKMASCLRYDHIGPWVTPAADGERPRASFDVEDFITSGTDTLYALSEEGKGAAGPLLTALCAAIAEEGKREGIRHGGRMPVPALFVLDEAANIVKWADLPKQYSHFGSRGLVVMTMLQSWAQGVRCWGPEGMTALWGAANVKVLGSGLDDAGFLRDRAELVGSHYELVTSVSRGKGGDRSTSTSRTTEATLTASDIAALPRGRVVMFTSGHRPTLAQSIPWMDREYAPEIHAALATAAQSATQTRTGPARRLRVVPPDTDQEQTA